MDSIYCTVKSLKEYIESLEGLNKKYPIGGFMQNPVSKKFVFRGCSDVKYKLLPGIYRKDKKGSEIEESIENDKYLSYSTEILILKDFINNASSIIKLPPDDYARWAEYAQHYGAPTRYLDWTKNPLVALWFACCNKEKDGYVSALHSYNYDCLCSREERENVNNKELIEGLMLNNENYTRKMPILIQPEYIDQRMLAQGSLLMAWGRNRNALEDMIPANFEHFEIVDSGVTSYSVKRKDNDGILFKILIPNDRKQQIIRELDEVGINDMMLFPGLDGIGKYIERKYRFNYQEMMDLF